LAATVETPVDTDDIDPNWVENYERGTRLKIPFTPENPTARGTLLLARLWAEVLPDLERRNVYDAPKEVPGDVSKWAVLPDWVELLLEHPHTQRNVFDWMDSWVPKAGHSFRGGAATLRRLEKHADARARQYGQGFNDPTPAFTFHGERLPYQHVREMIERWIAGNEGLYTDPDHYQLDYDSMQDWDKVMGGRCSTYVFCESSILFHGMTPHQDTDSPVPWDLFVASWKEVLAEQFPGFGAGSTTLHPVHLFVGTQATNGINIGNSDGAAGYPTVNMGERQIQRYLGRPKFKGRVTKGVAFQAALRVSVEWIEAGMPMSGPLYKKFAQPATLGYRGDRPVHLGIRALASRGQDSSGHPAANRLAATLPSRSIIIVPTCQILAESLWAQPLGDHITGVASPGFDWVDPDHTVKRLSDIKQLDLQQGHEQGDIATVGADASGWDRDVVGQFHACETAWYMSMFPEEAELLYVDAGLPLVASKEWVAATVGELQAGGEGTYRVVGLLPDGSERTQTVTARIVRFNFWEYISKVMTTINDAPIKWADYEVDAIGKAYDLSRFDPQFSGLEIVSNGGRRSGDAATGIGNTWTNLVVTRSAAKMSRLPALTKLRQRRANLQGTPVSGGYQDVDALARGDDLALAIRLDDEGLIPSEAVASGIVSVGMRANAKKQEASDIRGKPVFGFANVLVTEGYMGKLVGRTAQRYMVQESRGLNLEMLNAVRDSGNDSGLTDTLVATTATAKARLAPMAGFPLMDEHPLVPLLVEWAVHNDNYRLAYVSDESFVDGQITEEARVGIEKAARVEARAQARLRARRENVSVDLERLQEVYAGSTIHDHILNFALADNYQPTMRMDRVDNHTLFKEAVRTDIPLPQLA